MDKKQQASVASNLTQKHSKDNAFTKEGAAKLAKTVPFQMENGYIAVVPAEIKNKTESGILLVGELDRNYQTSHCLVVSVSKTSTYKPGDEVFFSKLVPDDVMVEDKAGKQYALWFVKETDVKASVRNSK